MNLYLMRHAQAAPAGGSITRDADRILTPRGEEDAALMGRALKRLDSNIDIVVTSPLARARQTGEIVGAEMSTHSNVNISNNLAPGFRAQSLFEELIALGAGTSIVAVGHQPDLGKFISFLIADSSSAAIAMESGAMAKIHVPSPLSNREAYLSWLITPEAVQNL
jgi:phosphohistidine phosphatase